MGGHRVLDFVNTVEGRGSADGRVELLPSYGDLLRFSQQSGILTGAQARRLARAKSGDNARQALDRAREVREALWRLLDGRFEKTPPDAKDLGILLRHWREAQGQRAIRPDDRGFSWQWEKRGEGVDTPLQVLAWEAAELITSPQLFNVRRCASETCAWLFLDTSKNHSRRWCDMNVCGNRSKARRYYARHGAQ